MVDVNVVYDYELYRLMNVKRRRHFDRTDPRETMPAAEILRQFRFNSPRIDMIVDMIRWT